MAAIWLLSNGLDRFWLGLDHSVPAWDQSNHLSYSLAYLQALQTPDWFNGDWWRRFWQLSPKYPPLTYLMAVPFQALFEPGNDPALLTNWLYSAVLLGCVYALGKKLFTPAIGLWGAAILALMPRFYHTRLQFLLDTPLLAFTLLSFTALTFWLWSPHRREQWLWAGGFGLALGLGLLTKQSVLFSLFFPLLGVTGYGLWRRQWERIVQLILSFFLSALLWFPWYRTNWIYLFSTAQNSNAIPASLEGDPPVNTWAAWVYYWKDLPLAVTWVWLIPPLVGIILWALGRLPRKPEDITWPQARPGLLWLGFYISGVYLVFSALYNKDSRYILPYLPVLALVLAYGLTRWRGRWRWLPGAVLALAVTVTLTNLFPVPGSDGLTQAFNPSVLFRPQLETTTPNEKIFPTALQAAPYQRVNLGVIPNTSQINPNTLNYFGMLAQFQGFGRELGSNPETVAEDSRNFNWLLTQTGDNGFAQPAQLDLAQSLPQNPDFQVLKTWALPDQNQVALFQRRPFPLEVEPLANPPSQITLAQLELPPAAPPGKPLPVTYRWQGSGEALNKVILLITWQSLDNPEIQWYGDHAPGFGDLLPTAQGEPGLTLTERTALLPPSDLPPGRYQLQIQALTPNSQSLTPVRFPPTESQIDPQAPPLPAPPPDRVSQLRQLAPMLGQGIQGLDPIFAQVGRLNIYDPTQDYLRQADLSLSYRLSQNPPDPIPLTYGLVLARVLQQNPQAAIAALRSLVELEPENPYAHAYLAFVHLYDWQGLAGERALAPALKLAPAVPELQYLQAVAQLMQGNLWGVWQTLAPLLQ
ncbi:MAG: phospholipid carrier-dependent glycosyltransferase [Cyanobacteriota bacterium]